MKKIVYIFLLYTFFATALASNNNINEIKIYKGNLKFSDICFIDKI